jgi:hypothetical protein
MNKENQKISNQVLLERRKSLQKEREQPNSFMNNFIMKLTQEHEIKLKDFEDERKEM